MDIGVALPHYGDDVSVERVVRIAIECERLGFDSVWVSDHLVFDLAKYGGSSDVIGCVEPMTLLAALAPQTTRVRLGTMVLCNEFRHPIVLANQAAAVHAASGERLELGIGAGWYQREFDMTGISFPRAGVRIQRLGESVRILRSALTGEPVRFAGRHYTVDGTITRPVPQRPPAVWIGGKGDRTIALAGEVADGWNASWFSDADAYAERASKLEDASVRRSIGQYAEGSAQQMVDRLSAFAAHDVSLAVMCFSSVPFGLDDPDDVARFAQDVLPHARDL